MQQGKKAPTERRKLIIAAIINHPEFSYRQIAKMFDCSLTYVCQIRQEEGIPNRVRGSQAPSHRWFKPKPEMAVSDGQ
jgi:hypothetical protein